MAAVKIWRGTIHDFILVMYAQQCIILQRSKVGGRQRSKVDILALVVQHIILQRSKVGGRQLSKGGAGSCLQLVAGSCLKLVAGSCQTKVEQLKSVM
jgi:hypothetical protein